MVEGRSTDIDLNSHQKVAVEFVDQGGGSEREGGGKGKKKST